MSRPSRTRTTRVVVTAVVSVIAVGSFVEYRRARRPAPVAAPKAADPVVVGPPRSAVKPDGVATSIKPLVTQTPGGSGSPTAQGALPLYSATPAPTPPTAAPEPAPPAEPTGSASVVLAEAKVKANAGDLLAARAQLNDALRAGALSDADATAVKKQMSDLNSVIIFSGRAFPTDPLGGTYKVGPGDRLSTLAKQHAVPYELIMQLNHMTDARKLRFGQTLKMVSGPFYAVVTKGKFTLDLYLGGPGGPGSMYVTSFPVGLGTDNSTPTGKWFIKNKAPSPAYYSPRGEGVIPAGDPKNPLGPYWLGLEGIDGQAVGAQSYGIHGTIDPDSIGKQASLGCIRLRNDDVAVVYKLLVERKSVVVVQN